MDFIDDPAGHGVSPKRLQIDNAWTYIHNRSLAELLLAHGLEHRQIPPRMPKRNGKIERYQQTLKREWGRAGSQEVRRPPGGGVPPVW